MWFTLQKTLYCFNLSDGCISIISLVNRVLLTKQPIHLASFCKRSARLILTGKAHTRTKGQHFMESAILAK